MWRLYFYLPLGSSVLSFLRGDNHWFWPLGSSAMTASHSCKGQLQVQTLPA